MNIEEVGSLEIIGGKLEARSARHRRRRAAFQNLAEMYFIKDNLIRMTDAPEPRNERKDGCDCERKFVVPLGRDHLLARCNNIVQIFISIFSLPIHILLFLLSTTLSEGRVRRRHTYGFVGLQNDGSK
jgi:hypothetical protein